MVAELPAIPVVLQGLGPIGQAIGRAVLERPELRIAGAVDPALAGRKLGEVLGAGAPDLSILREPGKAFAAARGGVVLHATGAPLQAALAQAGAAVEAGLSVISTSPALAYPWLEEEEAAYELDARCEARRVAVVGVGVFPGFALDRVAALLGHVTGAIRHVRGVRVVDLARLPEPYRRRSGLGMDPSAFDAAVDAEELGHPGLDESMALVLASCGLDVHDAELEEDIEPLVADEDVDAAPAVRAGQVAGCRQVLRAFVDGTERARLELVTAAHVDDPRDEVELDADPPVRAVLQGGVAGEAATAWAVVNAISAVTERQGLITVLDLPAGR